MSSNKIKDIIKIISKNTGIDEKKLNEKSSSDEFPRWDSIAHIKIMVEVEKKNNKKISTSKMSELNTISKIVKFISK